MSLGLNKPMPRIVTPEDSEAMLCQLFCRCLLGFQSLLKDYILDAGSGKLHPPTHRSRSATRAQVRECLLALLRFGVSRPRITASASQPPASPQQLMVPCPALPGPAQHPVYPGGLSIPYPALGLSCPGVGAARLGVSCTSILLIPAPGRLMLAE